MKVYIVTETVYRDYEYIRTNIVVFDSQEKAESYIEKIKNNYATLEWEEFEVK